MQKFFPVLICLLFLIVLVGYACSTVTLGDTPEPQYRVMVPHAVANPTVTPSPTLTVTLTPTPTLTSLPTPEVLIYDENGELTDSAWLSDTFGAVDWQVRDGVRLAALRWMTAEYVLKVRLQDESGQPLEGITVIRYWPDAPPLPEPLVWDDTYNQGVYAQTDANGIVDFAMGLGDYYFPSYQTGVSAIWVGGPDSYLLTGLGMLGGTNHDHLNSDWIVASDQAERLQSQDWGITPGAEIRYEDLGNGELVPVVYWPAK